MKRIGFALLLAFVTFGLYAVDYSNLSLSGQAVDAPWALLGMAALDAGALMLLGRQSKVGGWQLIWAIAFLYFGLKTALVLVEAAYLPEILSPALVKTLTINGTINALLIALMAVWASGRWFDPQPQARFFTAAGPMIRRLPLIGITWTILFVSAGMLIFQPAASFLDQAAADAYLADFAPENPMLILGLQAARGMLWGLFAWPIMRQLKGSWRRKAIVLALVFAAIMGSGLLLPNDILPASIRPAHLAEVMVENFLFGLALVWLLRKSPTEKLKPAHAAT